MTVTNTNIDDDFVLPSDYDDGDDFVVGNDDYIAVPPPPRCADNGESFRLRKNGSLMTCHDLLRLQYRLACTWERIRIIW